MNNLMIVGRVEKFPIINEKENYVEITLKVKRPFKNMNEEYEVDYLPIKIISSMKQSCLDCFKEDSLVCVKGRLSRLKESNLEIIAEKLSYISSEDNKNENF